MKTLAALLLLLCLQTPTECPLTVSDVQLKRPNYRIRGDRHRLEISLTNESEKDINSITFELGFWDYRHEQVVDVIKGVAGDLNPKYVLIKAGKTKTVESYLTDYPPPDNWTVDSKRFKIVFIKFVDGTTWVPEKKN